MSQHSFYLADLQPLRQHLAQWGQLHEPRFEPDGVLRWIEAGAGLRRVRRAGSRMVRALATRGRGCDG